MSGFTERYYNYLKSEEKEMMKKLTDSELLELVASHPFKMKEIKDLKKKDPDAQAIRHELGAVKNKLKVAEEKYVLDEKKEKELFDYTTCLLEARGIVVKLKPRDVYKEVEKEKQEKAYKKDEK